MIINSKGYELVFVQKEKATYVDCHTQTYVFKFKSEKTKTKYIVQMSEHLNDFFVIKFYAQKHSKSDKRYNLIINDHDIVNVLITSLKAIPYMLKIKPTASFGFIGSRTLDQKKIEKYNSNQRYRIYKSHIDQVLGYKTFTHKFINESSCYALYNNKIKNINTYHEKIVDMIKLNYDNVFDF